MTRKNLTIAACTALAFAVFVFDSNEAAAQCGNGGGYNSEYRSSYGYQSNYYPRTSYYRYPSQSYYGGHYSRGHYDYHPSTVYRHGNHLHVSPGHYDYHRGGHHYGH